MKTNVNVTNDSLINTVAIAHLAVYVVDGLRNSSCASWCYIYKCKGPFTPTEAYCIHLKKKNLLCFSELTS